MLVGWWDLLSQNLWIRMCERWPVSINQVLSFYSLNIVKKKRKKGAILQESIMWAEKVHQCFLEIFPAKISLPQELKNVSALSTVQYGSDNTNDCTQLQRSRWATKLQWVTPLHTICFESFQARYWLLTRADIQYLCCMECNFDVTQNQFNKSKWNRNLHTCSFFLFEKHSKL